MTVASSLFDGGISSLWNASRPGGGPQVSVSAYSSCWPPVGRFTAVQTIKDQTEVGLLSDGAKSEPLSAPLQYGIRIFRPPVPVTLSAFLTVCLPGRAVIRAYPVRLMYKVSLGSAYGPVA